MSAQLGWKSVYAYNNEDFGPDSLLGRASDREVVLTRALRAKLSAHFSKNPKNRPGTLKKLRSVLESVFAKKLDSAALDRLEKELIKQRIVAEAGGKLSYGGMV